MRSATCRLHAVLVAFLFCSQAICAQQAEFADAQVHRAPLFYIGINATAAAFSSIAFHGKSQPSVPRVLAGAAAGGVVMYAGQRVIGSGKPGLRLAGLETVALGASITQNIARGNAVFERVTLPFYPLYLTFQQSEPHVRVRASALATGTMMLWLARGRRPDILQSLYTGALVFPAKGAELECFARQRGQCRAESVGQHQFGAIAYARHPNTYTRAKIITHELEHVTQDTRDAVLFAVPAFDVAAANTGKIGHAIGKFLVLDGFLPLMVTSQFVGPTAFDSACEELPRFYECEAYALAP